MVQPLVAYTNSAMTALARASMGLASEGLSPKAEPRFETTHSGTRSLFLQVE
jgi:hypothetical protein